MKIKPLNDWAVIVPSEAGERTAGGLYIPDSAKEKPAEGVVEAIGPGAYEEEKHDKKKKEKKERKFVPTTVKPGDRVLYERFAGQKITVDNVERVLVRERDILGLVSAGGGTTKPLQLTAKTAQSAETSLATLAMKSIVATAKGAATQGKTKAKPAKKSVKKVAKKKGVKKAAKKKGDKRK